MLVMTDRTITRLGLEESSTKMIPALATAVVARGATTGRLVLLGTQMAMNQTCYALESTMGTPIALYCLLQREIGNLVNAAHGSVFDTITTTTFARSRIVLPPQALLNAFEDMAGSLFERVRTGINLAYTLSALREKLLPRLISGQLRLPEANEAVSCLLTGS
jgi:type I restriction enzyme S subunit